MGNLTKLPNIGKVIEGLLTETGVTSSQDLISIGSKEAFLRIKSIDSSACIRMLYALEGAIRGVKDTELPADVKEELKDFYRFLEK